MGGREAERRRRVKINKPSHRLTFGLMYLTMISSLPCFGSVLSALADVNALRSTCFTRSVSVSYIPLRPPLLISPFHTSGRLSATVRTDLFTLLDTKVGNYDQNSLVWRRKMAALIRHIVNYLLSRDITATILVFFVLSYPVIILFFIQTNSENSCPPKNT